MGNGLNIVIVALGAAIGGAVAWAGPGPGHAGTAVALAAAGGIVAWLAAQAWAERAELARRRGSDWQSEKLDECRHVVEEHARKSTTLGFGETEADLLRFIAPEQYEREYERFARRELEVCEHRHRRSMLWAASVPLLAGAGTLFALTPQSVQEHSSFMLCWPVVFAVFAAIAFAIEGWHRADAGCRLLEAWIQLAITPLDLKIVLGPPPTPSEDVVTPPPPPPAPPPPLISAITPLPILPPPQDSSIPDIFKRRSTPVLIDPDDTRPAVD